jgi:hypothetical protein
MAERRNGSFAESFGTSPGGSEPQGGPFPEALAKGKGCKGKKMSFRPKGEIFLRSLVSTRDDGRCPSLGALGVLAR